jgi:hypothetical protein
MKNIIIIALLSGLYHISNAQNYVLSPLGIKFPNFTTATRPAANSIGAGTVLYNATDNTHQYSNGTSWLNLLGTTTVPSGTANQTLRNNGSGWVADGLMQNNGNRLLIGLNNYDDDGLIRVNAGNFSSAIVATSTNSPTIYAIATGGSAVRGESTGDAIHGISPGGRAIFGTSTSGFGIYGTSNTGSGVFGTSTSDNGVWGFSTTGTGVFGTSSSSYGVFGSSGSSYGGKFIGRVRLQKGGNGDAGIEFEKSNFTQGGYVGMNGDNEMMIYGFPYGGAIQRWNVNGGSICYATSPAICSDIRLKKDFRDLSNSLSSITQLKGYNYYLRNEKNPNLQTGFIAQEIQKIFPELVNTGSDGYLSVDYTGLIPHLVESVKALKSENESLKERLLKIENLLNNSDLKLEAKR